MTGTKPKATAKPKASESRAVTIEGKPGDTEAVSMARAMVGPYLRHGILGRDIAEKMAGKLPGAPQFDDFGKVIKSAAADTAKGDMRLPSEMLTAQALSLDSMMTELMRRATMNLGDFPLAAERYARLAFKAQSNCRATLETLAKLHQPREQTVRHVHVNEGGRAVIADQVHNHTGGKENAKSIEQPHATGEAGSGPAMLGYDAQGNGVPISGGEGQSAMQDARRQGQRRT